MKFINRLFAWNDRRRARHFLQQVCDDWLSARMKFHEECRRADRALQDAQKLEVERFREEFFGKRNPVRSAFLGRGAA